MIITLNNLITQINFSYIAHLSLHFSKQIQRISSAFQVTGSVINRANRMESKLNLIVATAQNMGIGFKGTIPWQLKKDLSLFATLTKSTVDEKRKNAVIMGRRTWESIPARFCPLPGRVNVVLSRSTPSSPCENVLYCKSLDEALDKLKQQPHADIVENVWIIGGASVYQESMAKSNCHRIYVTRVHKDFECDVFMPPIDLAKYHLVRDPLVPDDVVEDNGLQFNVEVYEKNAS